MFRVSSQWVVWLSLVALLGTGCVDYLGPGEPGMARYFGELPGDPPPLVPPVSDREGNVYILSGDLQTSDVQVTVGFAGGGFAEGCDVHEGSRGPHGFIGRGDRRAWYWSGTALAEVSGDGGCREILDAEPASSSDLQYWGVAPFVIDRPSRTWTVALIALPGRGIHHAIVDLDGPTLESVRGFEPAAVQNLRVLGVGADSRSTIAVFVVAYSHGDEEDVTEAIYVDLANREVARAPLDGMQGMEAYEIAGFLTSIDGHRFAGVTRDGDLVSFDRSGGGRAAVRHQELVGVHPWEGRLFGVGHDTTQPLLTPIRDDGSLGESFLWRASADAQAMLGLDWVVLDERAAPRRQLTWSRPQPAIGEFPFLTPYPLDRYAKSTTGWILRGPGAIEAGIPQSSLAFVPFGIDYR